MYAYVVTDKILELQFAFILLYGCVVVFWGTKHHATKNYAYTFNFHALNSDLSSFRETRIMYMKARISQFVDGACVCEGISH